jgi:F0F1-type ATP synthase assembly protein I
VLGLATDIMNPFYWVAAKFVKRKLDLQEDSKMDATKPWYKSMTLWSDIVTLITVGVGIADTHFGTHIASSSVYATVVGILAAVGINGRLNATTTLTK